MEMVVGAVTAVAKTRPGERYFVGLTAALPVDMIKSRLGDGLFLLPEFWSGYYHGKQTRGCLSGLRVFRLRKLLNVWKCYL